MAKTPTRTTRPSSPPKAKQTQTSEAAAPTAAKSIGARTDTASNARPATNGSGSSAAKLDGATMTSTPRPTSDARPTPSHDEIAARAYELYVTRGSGEGEAMNDWLRAEGELRS